MIFIPILIILEILKKLISVLAKIGLSMEAFQQHWTVTLIVIKMISSFGSIQSSSEISNVPFLGKVWVKEI